MAAAVTVAPARPYRTATRCGLAPTVARIPDTDEFRRTWRNVPAGDRRRIVKAVNKGDQLPSRKEAALAVVLARRQQRFWRVAWLLGPVISVLVAWLIDLDGGLVQLLANGLLGAAVLMGMSVFFTRRAKRAEQVNTEHARHGRRSS